MAQINVTNLTFYYEGSLDPVFEDVTFSIDTNWKLGFVGRNGKGKTTFLRLLLGEMEYQGNISASTSFDYFPYMVEEEKRNLSASELLEQWKFGVEEWRVICELSKLGVTAEVLYRPFHTLSHGEQTKVMLAVLFSGDNEFLLIDEPTNHLDQESRELVKRYLASKDGFILVSHDRDLLDECVDHVLVLNRGTIEVQTGNFSNWWENKSRKDCFARAENEKHLREIKSMKTAADRTGRWADKNENTKIGFDPIREPDRSKGTRSYIGAKTKKAQARVKAFEKRIDREIQEKEGLLQDIEEVVELKVMPLVHHKKILVRAREYGLKYRDAEHELFQELNLEIAQGERVFFSGSNGCGKSSLIKEILAHVFRENSQYSRMPEVCNAIAIAEGKLAESGTMETAAGMVISYVDQDTSFLKGTLEEFSRSRELEYSLFLTMLRKLAVEPGQFHKRMEEFSEGQKKKVLIAASLMTPAHLYIWDEPLNYIDVFSRMQIEKLIQDAAPTMILVEHDVKFREKIGTRVVEL